MIQSQTGFAMLLKSFGVDPEQIKGTLMGARDEVVREVNEVKTRLIAIDDYLVRIESKQDEILELLKNAPGSDYEKTIGEDGITPEERNAIGGTNGGNSCDNNIVTSTGH